MLLNMQDLDIASTKVFISIASDTAGVCWELWNSNGFRPVDYIKNTLPLQNPFFLDYITDFV